MEVCSVTVAWDLETSDGEGRDEGFAIGVRVEGVDVDFVCQCQDGFFELIDFIPTVPKRWVAVMCVIWDAVT